MANVVCRVTFNSENLALTAGPVAESTLHDDDTPLIDEKQQTSDTPARQRGCGLPANRHPGAPTELLGLATVPSRAAGSPMDNAGDPQPGCALLNQECALLNRGARWPCMENQRVA